MSSEAMNFPDPGYLGEPDADEYTSYHGRPHLRLELNLEAAPKQREDYGFFGPGSATWKVWASATAATIGFQRAVAIETFDPDLSAAVNDTAGIYVDPVARYDKTVAYFATVAFADGQTAIKASDALMHVHKHVTGIEPVSGKRYNANNPESQLWIHVTAWHSVLKAYEMFGPGKLSERREREYWRECGVAAELQTCRNLPIPTSRDEVHEYFEAMRPKLGMTEDGKMALHQLLNSEKAIRRPKILSPAVQLGAKTLNSATIATMPMWMREMGDIRQPRAVDLAVAPVAKHSMRAIGASATGLLMMLDTISPSSRPIMEPILRRQPPRHKVTVTPAQAREQLYAR
jgi:uncharacterized protein (DUF2236 family)